MSKSTLNNSSLTVNSRRRESFGSSFYSKSLAETEVELEAPDTPARAFLTSTPRGQGLLGTEMDTSAASWSVPSSPSPARSFPTAHHAPALTAIPSSALLPVVKPSDVSISHTSSKEQDSLLAYLGTSPDSDSFITSASTSTAKPNPIFPPRSSSLRSNYYCNQTSLPYQTLKNLYQSTAYTRNGHFEAVPHSNWTMDRASPAVKASRLSQYAELSGIRQPTPQMAAF